MIADERRRRKNMFAQAIALLHRLRTDRSAVTALEYGLIDRIIDSRKLLPVAK